MAVILLPAVATTPFCLCSSSDTLFSTSGNYVASGGLIRINPREGRSLSTRTGWRQHQLNVKKNHKKCRGASALAEVFACSGSENWQPNAAGKKNGASGKEVGRFGEIRGRKSEKWRRNVSVQPEVAIGGSGSSGGGVGWNGGGGGGDDSSSSGDENGGIGRSGNEENYRAAMAVLAGLGRSVESLPGYMSAALEKGRIPPSVLERFLELERSPFRNWLLQFGGFRERLLADDLFLTKLSIEVGVGLFTKSAAEYEKRREKFVEEFDFVVADVIMALVADTMLVWLPAPTVSMRPALTRNASAFARFLSNCPDNAFQVALRGTSYTALQRVGAIVRNGGKLLVVGSCASLMGSAATNGLIKLRQVINKDSIIEEALDEEVEKASVPPKPKVPILGTTLAYGAYTSISSNLRYQLIAGVVEQRILEPLLEDKKIALSVCSFVVRTGNSFLGSLLWVDWARWCGVQ